MTTRTYEQLRSDLADLNRYIDVHKATLAERGILTNVLALTSGAEANLDADKMFPSDPWRDRKQLAHNKMSRAWLAIQSKAMTDSEIGESISKNLEPVASQKN